MDVKPASSRVRVAPLDDATLVVRACGGDDAAFSELFRRHSEYVARVAHRLLWSDAEVDDVVQDTFVLALRSIEQVREPEHVRAWLATVAVRQCQRRLKARSRWWRLSRQVAEYTPRATDPELDHRLRAIYAALGELPDKLRVPWILYAIEGHPHAEVAAMCDASVATIKRRLAEAEERLERRLGEGR